LRVSDEYAINNHHHPAVQLAEYHEAGFFGAPSPRVLSPHERATEHDAGRFENEIAFKGRKKEAWQGCQGFPLAVDDHELAVLSPITERRHAAHPHPLPFRGGDLVADALADDLALELREGQQNVQGQAPHRGRGVELLRDRNKGSALGVKDLDDLGKIGE
jgi:hypothetical protein